MSNKTKSRSQASSRKQARAAAKPDHVGDPPSCRKADVETPPRLKIAGGTLPQSHQWSDWVRHLSSRKKPTELAQLVDRGRVHPLMWALPDPYEQLSHPPLLKQLTHLSSGKQFASSQLVFQLRAWLSNASGGGADSTFALECLGWCHALPRVGQMVSEEEWRDLLELLENTSEEAGGIALDDDPVAHQLLNGELPLAVGYLFPEVYSDGALLRDASSGLSFGVVELTDGEGLLHARHLARFRELLACWTRCSLMASAAGWDCFDEDARDQYEWAVRQACRLSRSDGSLVLSNGVAGNWCADLFRAALEQGGDEHDAALAELALPGGDKKRSCSQSRTLPEPTVYSEWSEACVMRPRWSRKAPQFCCFFSDRELRTELSVRGQVVWSGMSSPRVRVNGDEARVVTNWAELCWFTDEDVHYLELEAEYEGGWKIQRQMLLARQEDVLLLADALVGPQEAEIRYDSCLPLGDDVTFLSEDNTSEGYLKNDRPLCTVLPLALPEWRDDSAPGRLAFMDGQLHLRMNAAAQRLYVPLFIDLSSRRWVEKRTWRQLTVAERLEIQPADVAVGYRVQLGRKQWLIYRSLAPRRNRTVLGQNLSNEFFVARFDLDGGVRELIEIES